MCGVACRRTTVAGGLAIAFWLLATDAWACVCGLGASLPCSLESTAAFVGTALSVTEDQPVPGDTFYSIRYHFQVTEPIAGVQPGRVILKSDNTSCGVHFDIGQSYLVVSGSDERGEISGYVCSTYVTRAERAGPELHILRRLREGARGGIVYGQLKEIREPQAHNRPTDPELYPDLPDVRVTISGDGFYRETVSDRTGRFMFEDVPVGHYRVVARVRPPLRILPHIRSFHSDLKDPERLEISNCPVELSIGASRWQAMIRGAPPLLPPGACDAAISGDDSMGVEAAILFDNGRDAAVHLYRLSTSGERIRVATLAPGASRRESTFVSQRWIVTTEAGKCLAGFQPIAPRAIAYVAP